MGGSYFDKEFKKLRSKLVSDNVNADALKLSHCLPQQLTAETLPYLTIKLFEVFYSMIGEVIKMNDNMKEPEKSNIKDY